MKAVFIIVFCAVITPLSLSADDQTLVLLCEGVNNIYDALRMNYICLAMIFGVLLFMCARLK